MPEKLPNITKKKIAIYVCLAMLLLLVIGELSLRIFADYDSKFNVRIGSHREWDPHRRYRLRKNYSHSNFTINSKGFLGPEFAVQKKGLRVVALGDSCTFYPPKNNYPRLLENFLKQANPQEKIEVINAGCPGYDSLQAYTWYQREIDNYAHDILIIYLGWNDMGQYHPEGLPYKLIKKNYLKKPSFLELAFTYCYLLRFVFVIESFFQRSKKVSNAKLSVEEKQLYQKHYPIHFEQNLTKIIEIANAKKRKVFLLNYASLVTKNTTKEEYERMHFPRRMGKSLPKYLLLKSSYEKALKKAAKVGATIIDIESLFTKPKERTVFLDSVHFDKGGAKKIAKCVFESLQKHMRKK